MATTEIREAEQTEQHEETLGLGRERERIRMNCHDLLSAEVGKSITKEEYETFMINMSESALEAGGAISEEQKTQWMQTWPEYTRKFIREVKDLSDAFLADIAMAERKGWISRGSARRWEERLHLRSGDWAATRSFLHTFNKSYMRNWEDLHKKKETLRKKVQRLGLSSKQVPELAELEHEGFDDLHYDDKLNAVSAAIAAVAVFESGISKNGTLYRRAKDILDAAVGTGAMSGKKTGKWLESLFDTKRSPDEIEEILEGTLKEYIGAWTKVRYRFDRIERQMKKQGVPQGFNLLSAEEFLDLDFPQRESYVEEAERSMNISLSGPSDKPIDQLKLQIRHELQVKDWEGAEELIAEAWKIAEGEDVHELESMERYLEQFRRIDEEESIPKQSIAETLESMREALAEAPGSVQMLYIEAMQRGYDRFSALTTQMYNLIWCRRNGYLDDHREEVLYRSSFEETKTIVEKGHREHGLENINLNAVDAEEKSDAMRPYRKTWAPTLYHMNCADGSTRARYLEELQGKNATRDYWSTLRLTNISYELQARLVQNVHQRLKSGMRKLREAGVPFTLFDSTQKQEKLAA